LPTEAEWECGARAGLYQAPYIWGSETPSTNLANIGLDQPVAVGQFRTNLYALHDMAGNVGEWCADWYSADFYKQSPKSNPKGPSEGEARVIRGGSFLSAQKGDEGYRASARDKLAPDTRRPDVGFRCVKDAF
jgi:formylglycine-generating enzyme required for sulfatase activity